MDDLELWRRFAKQDLAHAEWDHRLHLRTAFLHLCRFDLDEAHLRLRAGIIRLNQSHGLEESPTRGYFETMTFAWLSLVADARERSGVDESRQLLERCPELLDRNLLLRHYSRERLVSTRARAIFVPPDLLPLPGTWRAD